MDAILRALERHRARATFFLLGWISERDPSLLKRCLAARHEIASHGYEHLFLQDLDPELLDQDLARTEEALVAAGAPRPIGFRASTFTLTRKTWWAFDVLVRRGYRYDSSVHPVRHPVYGVPGFEPGISVVTAAGGEIVEFPVRDAAGAREELAGRRRGILPPAAGRADLSRAALARGARETGVVLPASVGVRSRATALSRAAVEALPSLPEPRADAAAPRGAARAVPLRDDGGGDHARRSRRACTRAEHEALSAGTSAHSITR
jgi:hypothetical protein